MCGRIILSGIVFILAASCSLYAAPSELGLAEQSAGSVEPSGIPVPSPMLPTSSTNKPPPPVRSWELHPDAIAAPGAHNVTTNTDGTPVHHFSLRPVVTNMTALTNSLVETQERRRELDKELKGAMERETTLKIAIMADYKTLTGIATNFVPKDAEGKKIKERMDLIVVELKTLQEEFRKRLEEDPEFKAARAKLDGEQSEFKALQERKTKIREEMGSAGADMWQINNLKEAKQAEDLKKATQKAKVRTPVAEPKTAVP